MTRAEMMAKIAAAHEHWSAQHGDAVPYVASDGSPHDGETTDLAIWQADRSAPPEIDDPLNATLKRILDEGYDQDEPLLEIPDD